MYRSKDQALMDGLKESVLKVTKGEDNPDRKYALNYLRTHIKVDDLHQYAMKKFPGKVIEFGQGSLQPKIVIVTKDPIKDEDRVKLDNVWMKMKISEDDVYYAHLRFIKTKKKQAERLDIFEKLVHMLRPTIILAFDGVKSSKFDTISSHVSLLDYPIEIISNPDKPKERKELTAILKSFRPILRN